jgi:predicted nucleic acid-binding protein
VTLVDSNVVLDVLTGDAIWFDWSIAQMEIAARAGPLIINEAVYAEVSVGFATIERLDSTLSASGLAFTPSPRAALFLAGKAFRSYRASGGSRTGVLPDFFIGAHAAVRGAALLTRDVRRYRTYFPTVELISPRDSGFEADGSLG